MAAHAARPDTRIAYVMTDGAALPLAFSDLTATMVERGLLVGTVTAGHAFGGDLEAVNVASALTLARHVLHADLIVVGMGPGVVGTGTALGTTSLEAAAALDTVAALGGRPVACLRVSVGRPPGPPSRASATTPAPSSTSSARRSAWPGTPGLGTACSATRSIEVTAPDTAALLAAEGLHVTTMGRTPGRGPRLLRGRRPGRRPGGVAPRRDGTGRRLPIKAARERPIPFCLCAERCSSCPPSPSRPPA